MRIVAFMLALSVMATLSAAPPNVVLIVSDDHGWADYSFMGHEHVRTPHLDRLAGQSLTFRRGYVPSSLCRPSLATILTGLYPRQHRVTSNDPPAPRRSPEHLAQRRAMIDYIEKSSTLPRLLAERGYVSFQSGKWWEGHYQRGGFTHGMTHGDPDRGGRHGDEGLKIGRDGMGPVLDFIDAAAAEGKPFFVWYAPMLPHSPHNPPPRLLEKYRDAAPSPEVARYWAMCEWFDETCGELLGHLDEKGLAENTLVLYVADNGWIQDPDAGRYAPRSKRSPYDGGLRTPIMVRWLGHVEPRFSDRLAGSIDLVPTVLAAVGLEPTPEMLGINLLDRSALEARDTLFGEIFEHNAVDIHDPASSLQYRWVVEGDWKLIVPAPQNTPDGIAELFHITRDPHEERNLAAERPELVERLTRRLDEWWPGQVE